MAPTVKTEPNEYEAQRAANIAKNQALLRDLQLDAAKAGLGLSKPAVRATSTSSAASDRSSRRKKASVKKEPTEVVPRRTSSRLAGLSADSPGAKRKAEEEAAALQEAARAKCRRVGGELDLSQIVVAGRDWDARENFLANVVVGGAGARAGAKYERTFTQRDVEETGDKGLKELREQMSGLKLYEGFVPNSMPLSLHDVSVVGLVESIAEMDYSSFLFDISTGRAEDHPRTNCEYRLFPSSPPFLRKALQPQVVTGLTAG